MDGFFRYLGLTVGCIQNQMAPGNARSTTEDITYGTNAEFGFDYLRDNGMPVQGRSGAARSLLRHHDEVDSILIDEARTLLIISGPPR